MKYRHIGSISGKGSGRGQFAQTLRGITVDKENRILAVGDSAVRVFSADGELLKEWSTSREGYCIAVAHDGKVYVGQEGQIEIFDDSGAPVDRWRDEELLGLVTAIGFADATVLAADAKQRCIRRLDQQGNHVNDIGDDNKRKGLLIPNGIVDFSVGADGVLHVANPGKHRVERYSADGKLLGHFGRFDGRDPSGFAGCCNPTNVKVSTSNLTYVTEKAAPRAKVYDAEGGLLAVIATDAFDPACKNMDLTVDSRGWVYIVDTVKLQILVFAPVDTTESASSIAPQLQGVDKP